MVLTDFLKNLSSGNLTTLAQQASSLPQTITGQSVSPTVSQSASFQSALSIFDNILKGGELPETFRQSVTTQNLLSLGQTSRDISEALDVERKQRQAEAEALGLTVQTGFDNLFSSFKPLQPQPLTPDMSAGADPTSTTSEIKDTLTKQLDAFAGAIGVSAATAAIIIGGIAGILLIRK